MQPQQRSPKANQAQPCWVVWATDQPNVTTAPARRRKRFPNTFALLLLSVGYVLFGASLFLPVLVTGDAWEMTHSKSSAWGLDLFLSGRAMSLVVWVLNAPLLASVVCYVCLLQRRLKAGHPVLLCLMVLHWIGFAAGVFLMPVAVVLAVLAQMTLAPGPAVVAWGVGMLCVAVGLSLLSVRTTPATPG